MTSDTIGFGVIGLGIGASRCKMIHDNPRARLVAVSDLKEERGKKAEADFGTTWILDYHDLLARDRKLEAARRARQARAQAREDNAPPHATTQLPSLASRRAEPATQAVVGPTASLVRDLPQSLNQKTVLSNSR